MRRPHERANAHTHSSPSLLPVSPPPLDMAATLLLRAGVSLLVLLPVLLPLSGEYGAGMVAHAAGSAEREPPGDGEFRVLGPQGLGSSGAGRTLRSRVEIGHKRGVLPVRRPACVVDCPPG